jgi:hypothetical protein
MADQPLPWTTQPSDQGDSECDWCFRAIYLPAVPCSVRPVDGLLEIPTQSGQGERCKYELVTRDAAMATISSARRAAS